MFQKDDLGKMFQTQKKNGSSQILYFNFEHVFLTLG